MLTDHETITRPYYRMPVGFGPALGPRRGPDGQSFNGERSRATSLTVTYRTDQERLQSLLPPGFLAPPDPTVRVRANFGTDYAWLAGRGYNYVEVVFSATFAGTTDTVAGDFVAVMWESMADPIISGREDIGLPKLFADIPAYATDAAGTTVTASWEGFRFLTLTLDGLSLGPWPHEREASTPPTHLGLGGGAAPRLYYKYVPRTGALETPDVAYVTATPPQTYAVQVLETWTGTGSAVFETATWEQLPTLVHIVNKLAELPIQAPVEASMSRLVIEFNDLADQRILT